MNDQFFILFHSNSLAYFNWKNLRCHAKYKKFLFAHKIIPYQQLSNLVETLCVGWPGVRPIESRPKQKNYRLAVVVAQLVERSLPIPEARGSNKVIGEIYIEHLFTCLLLAVVKRRKLIKKRGREWPIFKKLWASCLLLMAAKPIQLQDTVINKFQHGHSKEKIYFSNMQCWLTIHLYPYWRLTPIQPRDTVINKFQHGHYRKLLFFKYAMANRSLVPLLAANTHTTARHCH